jgi:xylose dehydrogenase (NAD/NADP)
MPLRLGLLSTAAINHRAILQWVPALENLEVSAVASRTKATAAAYSEGFGIPKFYESYDRLIDDPEIDAVYVSAPNSLHVEWTRRALRSGKHVLCEKPLSADLERVLELEALAEDRGLCLMEAMHYRFHPALQDAIAAIRNGTIGTIESISVIFEGDIRPEDDIRLQPELEGGALMDTGCYCLDLVRWATADDQPKVLTAVSEWSDKGVDLSTEVTLSCSGNVQADFFCTLQKEEFDCYAKIIGASGSIELRYPFLPVTGRPETPKILFACLKDGVPIVENISTKSAFHYQLQVFKDRIEKGLTKITDQTNRPYYNAALLAEVRKLMTK